MNNPQKICKASQECLDKLLKCNFVINDDFDELSYIKKERAKHKNTKHYSLMILPTYNCNFSCWYCIQDHKDEYMSSEIIERIKKHIVTYLFENKIKSFEICWFGGEPLLAFDIVTELSSFASTFCNTNKIRFFNSITTNGFLIDKNSADKMNALKFKAFQITIDGDRERHNNTRNAVTESSFDRIVKNIIILLETINDVYITLRFNYTTGSDATLLLNQLNELIPVDYRKRINFLPRKVWQIEENEIKCEFMFNLFEQIVDSGYNLIDADIKNNFTACYVEGEHFNTVFHTGGVDKCSNIQINECKGYLDETGKIAWNALNNYELNNTCLACKYLPICMGSCPLSRDIQNCNDVFIVLSSCF